MKEKNTVKKLSSAPLASKMCTNTGYLGHGRVPGGNTVGLHCTGHLFMKEKKSVKKLAAAPLASKMCTHKGYRGHGPLEGIR
jgi:hypothetical protein